MYLGDDKQNGIFNAFLEILNNACDEAIMGRGDKIEVKLSEDSNSISIIDHGAGIPHGANKDSEEVLIELFTAAHTSGKFNSTNYKKVRGLHGVGSSAVCVCSTEFKVVSKRDGAEWKLVFKDGIPQTSTAIEGRKTTQTGTIISFTPDKSIFHLELTDVAFDYERIRDELELTSYFIPNVTFLLSFGDIKEKFLSKQGLRDFAASRITNSLHKNYIYGYKEFDDEVEVEVFAQWTQGKETSYVFSNGALNSEGGTPISGAKTAFTRTVNSLAKSDFDGDMIRKGLVYIINIRHPHPIYQNQVKNKIQNSELKGYTQTVFTEAIKEFAQLHQAEFSKIVDMLTKEKRAEHAAEKARLAVLTAQQDIEKNQRRKVFNSDKLKDAEFLGQDSTLLIVEGNSAAGSMSNARDTKKYGILGLRGKIINCLSNDAEKIFANEEIKLLLSAMNIVPGKYNASKLRYGKIAICTDADSDGYHIGLLVMSALLYLAPEFIKENRLCWLRTPLFIVTKGKKHYYYYNDNEFAKAKTKGEVHRAKGLGALSPDMAKESMFSEEYQRMDVIEPTEQDLNLLSLLMGEDNTTRREFVLRNIDFNEVRE